MATKTKPKKLVVPYDDALALLKAAGVKTKWDHEKVQKYFSALPEKVKEDDLDDEDLQELYLDVKSALESGGSVTVEAPEEVKPGPAPEPARPKAKKKAKAEPEAKKEKTSKPSKANKETYRSANPRPGICREAMQLLEKASESKPLTKERLYELLCKRFPSHPNPESMKSTAYRAPYWIPYYFEVDLNKSPKGYWLTRSYTGDYRRVPPKKKAKD